jgi:hypothetical protein
MANAGLELERNTPAWRYRLDFLRIVAYTFLKPRHLFSTDQYSHAWERRDVVDIWWVALAFVCGGQLGMLLFAMFAIARQNGDRSDPAIPGWAAASKLHSSISDEADAATG